jgi:hypothetical protein
MFIIDLIELQQQCRNYRHGKTRDFIIEGTIYLVQLFEVSVFERKVFSYLEI